MTIREEIQNGATINQLEDKYNSPICSIHNEMMTFGTFSSKPDYADCHISRRGNNYYCNTCVDEVRKQITLQELITMARKTIKSFTGNLYPTSSCVAYCLGYLANQDSELNANMLAEEVHWTNQAIADKVYDAYYMYVV